MFVENRSLICVSRDSCLPISAFFPSLLYDLLCSSRMPPLASFLRVTAKKEGSRERERKKRNSRKSSLRGTQTSFFFLPSFLPSFFVRTSSFSRKNTLLNSFPVRMKTSLGKIFPRFLYEEEEEGGERDTYSSRLNRL